MFEVDPAGFDSGMLLELSYIMPAAAKPKYEAARLASLMSCNVLDTADDPAFDELTLLASELLDAPICLVSLVDGSRQWFKSRVGLDAMQTPREQAFCAYAILEDQTFVIEDATLDQRTCDNPLVTGGPQIRFYAGHPLVLDDGSAIGTLCIIDTKPRSLSERELSILRRLARQVVQLLHLYRESARAEREHNEARSLRRSLNDHTLLSITDRTGRIIDANDGFCKISGYSREELLGQDHRLLNSGHHPKLFWKEMWRTIRSGQAWRAEVCNRAKSGSLYWVDSTNIPKIDEQGNVLGFVSFRFDITERKRLEAQVKATRDQFQSLVNNIPGVTYRCRLDEHWTMLYISEAVEELTGYPPEDFVNNRVRSYESVILPDDSKRIAECILRAIHDKITWEIEYRIRRRDGAIRWVHEKGSYIADPGDAEPFLDGFILDITERVEARQRLSTSHEAVVAAQERYELSLEGSRDAIFDWDVNRGQMYFSPRWAELLKLRDIELKPAIESLYAYTVSEDRQRVEQEINAFIREVQEHLECEFRMKTQCGQVVWVLLRAAARRHGDGTAERVSGSVADISENKAAEAEMLRLIDQDQLTGLASRTKLMDRLEHALDHSKRSGGHCAILFFDFDRFKVVNDSLGHQVGDELLCSIADRLRSNIREVDTAARFGGDEFVILLENLSESADARKVADNLLALCAMPHLVQGHNLICTASIGLVTTDLTSKVATDMLRDADTAMYQAKANGKGRVVEFDKTMHEASLERLELEKEIRGAIANDLFSLHYQPIVNLENGQPVGVEALARWDHPERGPVSPGVFIEIAEDSNQMQDLGDLVLRHACKQIQNWKRRQIIPPWFTISVNFSKVQLMMPDFPEYLSSIVHDCGIQPSDIKIEVTETTIVDNRAGVVEVLKAIRTRGFFVMMDDFGTGHSSLSGLHTLPVDELKIDQSFIRHVEASRELIAITSSIVTLAGNLSLPTIGEGIEDASHVALLQDIGCDFGQGYFFSRPLPADQFELWLASQSTIKTA